MKTATVLTATALFAVAAGVLFAQTPFPAPGMASPAGLAPLPVMHDAPPVSAPVPPPEPTVDQLLDALEKMKAEQAALAKKEQELLTAVRAKLAKQSERATKLGVTPADQPKPVEQPKPATLPSPAVEPAQPGVGLPPSPVK